LVIRDGNTHYPSNERTWRFFNGSFENPPALVVIDGSGEITLDALDWLGTQNVPLIRLTWDGQFVSVVTAGGQAASTEKVYWQERTRKDPNARLRFARDLIREKAHYTVLTMEKYVPRSKVWGQAYKYVAARARHLEQRAPRTIQELLGIEGSIAAEYFRAWTAVDLKWKITKRHPIPDDWTVFTSRAALRENTHQNYRATHPVNAMLNYAYGVLLARTQIRLIGYGFDPTIGILHDRQDDGSLRPALALDYMEPMRPVVDRAILRIIESETFSGADFSMQHDGVCRLNPELARRVAQSALEYYSVASDTAWLGLGKQ
jgi:CRISPR-associated protein Cas1